MVIAIDNIGEHIKTLERAGGKVLGEPVDIPGVGRYVSFLDTEGNRIGMIQPTTTMR
ncbi:MAG TPA: VOC family protein [Nitrososphaera sp.]|nr:VOC family protein [Nitrososphaera sp.]